MNHYAPPPLQIASPLPPVVPPVVPPGVQKTDKCEVIRTVSEHILQHEVEYGSTRLVLLMGHEVVSRFLAEMQRSPFPVNMIRPDGRLPIRSRFMLQWLSQLTEVAPVYAEGHERLFAIIDVPAAVPVGQPLAVLTDPDRVTIGVGHWVGGLEDTHPGKIELAGSFRPETRGVNPLTGLFEGRTFYFDSSCRTSGLLAYRESLVIRPSENASLTSP